MTPKDKSKELIDKFTKTIWESGEKVSKPMVIQCALIAAEEIIESIKEYADKDIINIHLIYWRKVKNELIKQKNNG